MNLRTYTSDQGRRRRSGRAGDRGGWTLLRALFMLFLPLGVVFAIFALRVMLNSRSEECQRRVAALTRELHEKDREIEHHRNRIESLSRSHTIFQKVAGFQLELRNPQPGQMRNLEPRRAGEAPAGPAAPPRRLVITSR
jgi:hypothetical protein